MEENKDLSIVEYFSGETPSFENQCHRNGHVFWYASDFIHMLGYESYSPKMKPLQKAIQVCLTTNIDMTENFIEEKRIVQGKEVKDFKVTRFACYLIAMNSDPKKESVAHAQAYLSGLAEGFQKYIQTHEDIERISLRAEATDRNKSLASAASQAGVTNYAYFTNKGYLGLYNMPLSAIKSLKGIPQSKPPLDYMGSEELGANIFRMTQTEAKIKREGLRGQQRLEDAAYEVGRQVRKTIRDLGGTMPESLPPREDIKKIATDLKQTDKKFKKQDQLPLDTEK